MQNNNDPPQQPEPAGAQAQQPPAADTPPDAQHAEAQHQETTARWLALITTGGFFGLIGLLLWLSQGIYLDSGYRDIVLTLAGVVGTGWAGIISFYFGSSVGSRQQARVISQALSAQMAMPGDDPGSPAPIPPDPIKLAQQATAIGSIAAAAKTKLAAFSTPSIDALTAEVVKKGNPPDATALLAKAQDAFKRMTANSAACATDADRAATASQDVQSAAGDATKLAAAADRLGQLSADCAAANHAFETASADFTQARDQLTAIVAEG